MWTEAICILILFDVNLFLHTLHSENIEEIDRIKQFLDEIPKVNTYIRVHLIVKGCRMTAKITETITWKPYFQKSPSWVYATLFPVSIYQRVGILACRDGGDAPIKPKPYESTQNSQMLQPFYTHNIISIHNKTLKVSKIHCCYSSMLKFPKTNFSFFYFFCLSWKVFYSPAQCLSPTCCTSTTRNTYFPIIFYAHVVSHDREEKRGWGLHRTTTCIYNEN